MSEDAAPAAGQPELKRLIAILGICGFASNVTIRLIDPLVPTLAWEFGRSVPQIAAIVTVFSFSYALPQIVLGPLADSFGKLRTIRICLTLLALASVAAALARSFETLLVARALTGVVAGGVIPVAMAAIGDRAPMAERQVMLGRFLLIMIVGQFTGSALSGVVGEFIGWRAVFATAGAFAAGAAVLVMVFLKPRANVARAPFSLAGALGRYRAVFANPASRVLYLLVFLEGFLIFGVPPFVAAILHERAGIGSAQAGLAMAATGAGGLVYGLLIGRFVKRLGPARMIAAGGLVMAGAYGVLAAAALPWWTAFGAFFAHGLGFFLMHGTFQAQATELAPEARGSAVALFSCIFFSGIAMGPAVFGPVLHLAGPTPAILIFAAGTAALGLLAPRILPLAGSRT